MTVTYAVLATKARKNDPDILLRRMQLASRAPNVLHNLLGRCLRRHGGTVKGTWLELVRVASWPSGMTLRSPFRYFKTSLEGQAIGAGIWMRFSSKSTASGTTFGGSSITKAKCMRAS